MSNARVSVKMCVRCGQGFRPARGRLMQFTHPDDPSRDLPTCTVCVRELSEMGVQAAAPLGLVDA